MQQRESRSGWKLLYLSNFILSSFRLIAYHILAPDVVEAQKVAAKDVSRFQVALSPRQRIGRHSCYQLELDMGHLSLE